MGIPGSVSYTHLVADSKGNVREKGGIKSPIITRVEKGSEVTVLELSLIHI